MDFLNTEFDPDSLDDRSMDGWGKMEGKDIWFTTPNEPDTDDDNSTDDE